jgi:cyclase
MGSVRGALAAVDWLADLGPATVVPGHGPLLTGPDIERVFDEHRRYYRLVLAIAENGLARDRTPLEAARTADLGEFASWADAERLVLNLHRAYADHTSRDIDLIGALTDATAWLGGPMHTSV